MIKPIYRDRRTADPAYVSEIAHVKRFLERWQGDAAFREALDVDARAAAESRGLRCDGELLRPLWDGRHPAAKDPSLPVAPMVERYRAFIREKLAHRDELRQTGMPDRENFKRWRLRQMVRTTSQLGASRAHGIVHPIAAFELSRGCSVGCWFCGVNAPRLDDILPYTDANRDLWRGVLHGLREVVGPAAWQGFCYWATDPMDNPDYEQFCCDFRDILGYFPQTTTALPMRDVARMRRLLALSEERGCLLNRFSVLTTKTLDAVHETFTAEELAFVELVLQNSAKTSSKALAGRARERALKEQRKSADDAPLDTATVACISGFLVNMLDRSVKLISPCPASDRWPMGYRVHAQGTFDDAPSFRDLIDRMTSPQEMPAALRGTDPAHLRPDLTWSAIDGGIEFASPWLKQSFRGLPPAAMTRLAELLAERRYTVGELAVTLSEQHGVSLPEIFHMLNKMMSLSVLDDEPQKVSLDARHPVTV